MRFLIVLLVIAFFLGFKRIKRFCAPICIKHKYPKSSSDIDFPNINGKKIACFCGKPAFRMFILPDRIEAYCFEHCPRCSN